MKRMLSCHLSLLPLVGLAFSGFGVQAGVLDEAFDVPIDLLASTTVVPSGANVVAVSSYGGLLPGEGDTFVVICTGDPEDAYYEDPTDGDFSDDAAVDITFDVPELSKKFCSGSKSPCTDNASCPVPQTCQFHCSDGTTSCTDDGDCLPDDICSSTFDRPISLSFSYTILSAEYPEAGNTRSPDVFSATITDLTVPSGPTELISVAPVLVPVWSDLVNSTPFAVFDLAPDGIDAYPLDPPPVNQCGPAGLPDAGTYSGRSDPVDLTPGHEYKLSISISDGNSDGLLDSCVVIDRFALTSFEVLDANDDLLEPNGGVKTAKADLATGGDSVEGSAADGVTRILLREQVLFWTPLGKVRFELTNATSPADGCLLERLDPYDEDSCPQLLDVDVEQLQPTDLDGYAWAWYAPPTEFNDGLSSAERKRDIGITASWYPFGTLGPIQLAIDTKQLPFKLVRPPVVFVHGLWDNPGSWKYALVQDERFEVVLADYKSTNREYFSTNQNIVGNSIDNAIQLVRLDGTSEKRVAATQADVVGHSMGGVLARTHSARSDYRAKENLGEGDIHSLITLNTPHTGSRMPDLVVALRSIPCFTVGWFSISWDVCLGSIFLDIMKDARYPATGGAFVDLGECSTALEAIPPPPGTPDSLPPAHALVGNGSPGLGEIENKKLKHGVEFFEDICFVWDIANGPFSLPWVQICDDMLGPGSGGLIGKMLGGVHDSAVTESSQIGGLSGGQYQTNSDNTESQHLVTTKSLDFETRVETLLNDTDVESASTFGRFPSPSTVSPCPPSITQGASSSGASQAMASTSSSTYLLDLQLADTSLQPGDPMNITVTADDDGFVGDHAISTVTIHGPEIREVRSSMSFADVMVPMTAAGSINVIALGKDGLGYIYRSNAVTITVEPPSSDLSGIDLIRKQFSWLLPTDIVELGVLGSYAAPDPYERDLTEAPETSFLVDPPGLVDITGTTMTPLSEGTGVLVAYNDSTLAPPCGDVVPLRVVPEPGQLPMLVLGIVTLALLGCFGRRLA